MTEQPIPQSDINGKAPELGGQLCEAFIVQPFLQDGSLVEPCNVTFISCAGKWYRLYFDHGFVFWGEHGSSPESYESTQDGWKYQLTDLLPQISNGPTVVSAVRGTQDSQRTTVTFMFAGNRQIVLTNDISTDTTSYSVI